MQRPFFGGGGGATALDIYDATTLATPAGHPDLRVQNLTVTGTATITSTTTATGGISTAAQAGVVLGPFGVAAGNTGELRFKELAANGTAYTGFKAPDAITTGGVYTLPAEYPASDMILHSSAAGVLSWATEAAGGANTALSNLAAVAINTTLVSDTDSTDDLGTTAIHWANVYVDTGIFSGASDTIGSSIDAANGVRLGSGKSIIWSSTTSFDGSGDLFLTRKGAADLRLGAAPGDTNATNQALSAQGVLTGGTSDQTGATLTISSGQGKGAAAASSIIFQTPTVGGSGTTLQTMATRLTVATAAVTSTVKIVTYAGSAAATLGLDIGGFGGIWSKSQHIVHSTGTIDIASFTYNGGTAFGLSFRNNSGPGWSSTTDPTAAMDTGLFRVAAGVVGIAGSPSLTTGAGGFQPAQSANGATVQILDASEEITLSTSGTTTDSSANLLPANSIILVVTGRLTQAIGTATQWQMGDPTTAGRFTAMNSTVALGTTDYGAVHLTTGIASATTGMWQSAAAKVRITTTGTPSAGKVRVSVKYMVFVAPTT